MDSLRELDQSTAKIDAERIRRSTRETPHETQDDITPTYPIDALGGILGAAARAIADGYQIDPAIVGQSILGAAFLTCQHLADVQTPGGRKPLSAFMLTLALSGDGKSTADGPALAAIRDIERKEWPGYRDERAEYDALPKKSRGDPPVNPLRLIQDFTAEGMVRQFREGIPSIGAFSDEAGAVLGGHSFSTEKKLATVAALSSLFDGAGIRARARAGDERGGLEAHFDVRLSAHWLMQPGPAQSAIHDPVLGEQGFWPRTLLATPAPGLPRKFRPFDPATNPAVGRYWQRVTELISQPFIAHEYREIITCTPDANQLVAQFFEATERGARHKNGRLSPIRSWAARSTEHLLRIAGVLAVFDRGNKTQITADEIERAAYLVNHSLECWLNLLENKPVDEARQYSHRLLGWLKEQPNGQANETQMLRIGPKPRSASLRDSALGSLEAQKLIVGLGGKRWAVSQPAKQESKEERYARFMRAAT